MKSERKSIKKRLYISLSVVIIITIVSAISFFIFSTINYRDKVISEYIKEKSSRAIKHFSDKAVLIENNIQLLTKWGQNGLIHLDDTSNIDLVFIPLIEDVKDIFIVSGEWKNVKDTDKRVVIPANASPLWRGLVDAVVSGAKNIVVISDGYENSIKGMFDHVYKHFKDSGHDFNVIHINPVFAADSKSGTTRTLAEDIKPMPVGSYKYLETEFIFNQMIENTEAVKELLIHKYQKLIGGN